jgi:iron-sulfur cluster repair protein YtfE (RIC family)
MNAITFLRKEHEKIRQSLTEISHASQPDMMKKKFQALSQELMMHETMEQKIWYPRFKSHPNLDETIKHLILEEQHAEKKLKALEASKTDAEWKEKFTKLKQEIEHHAAEEEKKLFPHIEKILGKGELEEIGEEMQEFMHTSV